VSDPTDRLISRLVDDLQPVGPLPRLRTVAVGVGVAGGLLVALCVWLIGAQLESLQGPLLAFPAGLLLLAAGACAAALGLAVPGRDSLARLGGVGLALGLTTAALALIAHVGLAEAAHDPRSGCTVRALAVALIPALALGRFVWSAAPWRPRAAFCLAAAAAAALGALAAHIVCGSLDATHIGGSHLATPLIVALACGLAASTWKTGRSL